MRAAAMSVSRRSFIAGLAAAFAAPAIVRSSSIMPVKAMPSPDILDLLQRRIWNAEQSLIKAMTEQFYGPQWAVNSSGLLIGDTRFPYKRIGVVLG